MFREGENTLQLQLKRKRLILLIRVETCALNMRLNMGLSGEEEDLTVVVTPKYGGSFREIKITCLWSVQLPLNLGLQLKIRLRN